MKKQVPLSARTWGRLRSGLVLGLGAVSMFAWAQADIAPEPLVSSSGASIRPNLMFVLDDSGSMDYQYLPDNAGYDNLCFGTSSINRIFYDPTKTYAPPLQADGTPYLDATFTAARSNGFDPSSATTNLSVVGNLTTRSVRVGGNNNNPINSKFYYATVKPNRSSNCGNPDFNDFNIVTDASSWTAAQQTNYANWYSYYRTRMLMTRSAAGRVFATINPARFRVGFSTIHSPESEVADGSEFLNIRDFDAADQKTNFFTRLYGTVPDGSTPLRSALNKAGRYYAKQLPSQSVDPVQYSCQRNFTILSTDGYWNTDGEPSGWNRQLGSSSEIGNQDGTSTTPATPRPQLDALDRSNTLADVAMYYYKTDLRTAALGNCAVTRGGVGVDVCANDVARTTRDQAEWQHMNTFTLGLGLSGTLAYTSSNYENDIAGDYYNIVNGTRNWPDPISNTAGERIDDLWHAAVNGRGTYFSAANPGELANSLSTALNAIDANRGSGTAAATSNLRPVQGDRAVFIASFYSGFWDGDIKAQTIDVSTGEVESTVTWSAREQLLAKAASSRQIFFGGAGANLQNNQYQFTYTNLPAARQTDFSDMCPATGTVKLSQCLVLSAANKANITGTNLVNFLRGDRTYEASPTAASPVFRYRYNSVERYSNVLGDIVNAVPVYVRQPPFRYTDAGYAAFSTANASRRGVVYAGANDGMLHAFDALSGEELWAYIPTMVLPNLYKLADTNYAVKHQYFVDGAPVVGDVRDGSGAWHTILVGGLNAGGRGYYAIDITDPDRPQVLWEFTEADLGLTFGNPVLSKRQDGTWAVMFSSGYNNVSPGDGNGHLYVLNALTGVSIQKVPTYTSGTTPAGTTAAPNNLGRINAWVDDETSNMTGQVYGGDMLGNIWRFDIAAAAPTSWASVRLGQAVAPSGSPRAAQPITTKPELTEITRSGVRYRVVSVGTGRYLGTSDLTANGVQSVYVFKDTLPATTGLGVLRDNPAMVQQTLSNFTTTSGSSARRVATSALVDWATASGWFVDFTLTSGERIDVDMQQQLTQLTVVTNAPDPNACSSSNSAGSSWLYFFDLMTGVQSTTAPEGVLGIRLGNSLTAGITTIQLPNGSTKTIVVGRGGEMSTEDDPPPGNPGSGIRRTSWRELVN